MDTHQMLLVLVLVLFGLQRTDMSSEMEVMEVYHQDPLQLIVEKRKWKTELENKKRQLEDDRRALQHLKSKTLRERWLLEGPSADGVDQDQVRKQLSEDETKTRSLEDAICRLEQELISLETHTAVTSGSNEAVEVKGHSGCQLGRALPLTQVTPATAEVKVHTSRQSSKSRQIMGEMQKAMYSVEIKVERDRVTGETRVLSTNTTLPVDLCDHGVKVYEDEQKVVHEMNGEDGVHLLSSSEVEELIHKADEVSMMSQTVATVTSLSRAEVPDPQQGNMPVPAVVPALVPCVTTEITGLEAKASGEPGVAEVSDENPITMVFMGYQDVEDEDETKKLLGLQGTVKAELVLIDDVDRKVDPSPPTFAAPPTSAEPPETTEASDGEMAEEAVVEVKKKRQLCKCCSIM